MPSIDIPTTILFGNTKRVLTVVSAERIAEVLRLLLFEQGIKGQYDRVLIHIPMKKEVDYTKLAKALMMAGLCKNDSLIAYRRVCEHPTLVRIYV